MNSYVTDTHALLWHLSADPALSTTARDLFRLADNGRAEIFVSTITLVEIVYLCEKSRVPIDSIERILNLPVTVGSHYQIVSLDLSILHAMRRIVREEVPEMPDRIIAATALALNLPLITRDSQITKTSLIHCIW